MSLTITPAYGRDYRSKKQVIEDWNGGKDFVIADMIHPDCGRYINRPDAVRGKVGTVNVRYDKLRKVTPIKVK